jgi:hypothetical protein
MEAPNTVATTQLSPSSPWELLSRFIPLAFGSVIGANILTMSLMNFLETETKHAPTIYLMFLVLTSILMLLCKIKYPLLDRKEHLFCLSVALVLFLPKLPYLIENLLGFSVIPVGDDAFHIPYMASVIHTERFPPLSTLDNSQYLAYYYAAWIPGAAIYHTGLISTVKQALGIVKLVYCFFIAYFPVYASKVLFREEKRRRIFLVLCYLYGGFDFFYWLSGLSFIPSHSEWWALHFGIAIQFSNFITLTLSTPQHLLAALSILFAMYFAFSSRRVTSFSLAGLFLLSALFSSPFVTLGAIPFVIWYLLRIGDLRLIPIPAVIISAVSVPLWWIYLGNDSIEFQLFGAIQDPIWLGRPIWSEHKRAAFLVFLLVVFLEFGILVIASTIFVKRNRESRWLYILANAFLLSTFFCYYDVNYSMRGAIIPIFALTYLATPTIEAWLNNGQYKRIYPLIAIYFLGGILEYAYNITSALGVLRQSNTAFNAEALRSNRSSERFVDKALVDLAAQYPSGWELLEKYKPERKRPLHIIEARLMHPDNKYRVTLRRMLRTEESG